MGNPFSQQDYQSEKTVGEKPTIKVNSLSAMPFEAALVFLKQGKKVARAGWNGKGMFIYYVPANTYPAVTDIAKETFGEMVPYGAYIAMKTAQNNVVPWLASQTDILTEDWQLLN